MRDLARWASGVLFAVALAVAAALLVKSYRTAGDGFTAGALAALAGILQLVALDREEGRRRCGARYGPVLAQAGALVCCLCTFWTLLVPGLDPLTHFPRAGAHVTHVGSLSVHTAVVLDSGVGLAVYGALVTAVDRLLESAHEEDAEA